ncbi:DUF5615 family PIN-like protein [Litoribacter ruber]|uniref:DUF5615 family PIN-like protein n=1 Tax=Litoribacter ruber TaxID=702568 RepID=UPI001BDA2B84|nr:DUF5615 family PIN-like protein [Litoribacter ruber]MBT0812783.1 DUF5615 family PIN-like protein [Litoribacter ruber]
MSKILIDNNLSVNLIILLEKDFPGSKHVYQLGLHTDSDSEIWEFAQKGFDDILSKDKDFYYKAVGSIPPPKLIWITTGNCSNKEIITLLQSKTALIKKFLKTDQNILTL